MTKSFFFFDDMIHIRNPLLLVLLSINRRWHENKLDNWNTKYDFDQLAISIKFVYPFYIYTTHTNDTSNISSYDHRNVSWNYSWSEDHFHFNVDRDDVVVRVSDTRNSLSRSYVCHTQIDVFFEVSWETSDEELHHMSQLLRVTRVTCRVYYDTRSDLSFHQSIVRRSTVGVINLYLLSTVVLLKNSRQFWTDSRHPVWSFNAKR